MPMPTASTFSATLARSYEERHTGMVGAIADFRKGAADPKFLAQAKAEHDRLAALDANSGCPLTQRCYASAHQLKFLQAAFASLKSSPIAEEDMPSKLNSLAALAKGAVADIETGAAAALVRLNKAKDSAGKGVDGVNAVSAQIEQAAKDLSTFAAETSNFPPGEK
jgi:hypothetical protein